MTETELALAAGRVGDVCDAIDAEVSPAVRDRAEGFARRADHEHPINRSPGVVAASAVYLAALLENEKITQRPLADGAGVSTTAIRECYHELFEHEGLGEQFTLGKRSGGDGGDEPIAVLTTPPVVRVCIGVVIALFVGVLVAHHLLVESAGVDTYRGFAENAPTVVDLWPVVALVALLALAVTAWPYVLGGVGR